MFTLLVAHVRNAKSILAFGARSRIAAVTCTLAQKAEYPADKKSIGLHWKDDLVAGNEAGRSSDAVNSGAIGQLMF